MILPLKELKQLSIAERLQLVEDLWDTLALEEADIPIPNWQKKELLRRRKEHFKNPGSAVRWQKAKSMIRKQNG